MFSKKLAALVAASLVVATSSATAQSNALVTDRAGAAVADANAMGMGRVDREGDYAGGFWVFIIGAALLAAFILVILEDEDEDLPESP